MAGSVRSNLTETNTMTKDDVCHIILILTAWKDGVGYQYRMGTEDKWQDSSIPPQFPELSNNPKNYRIKPKPGEWWTSRNDMHLYDTEEEARSGYFDRGGDNIIKVREVLPE